MMAVAEDVCNGRILMTHEGGYSSAATVPFFAHAVIETMAQENLGIEDRFKIIGNLGQQELQPHPR